MSTTPLPLDGEVHLYCLDLPQKPSELSRFGRILSARETDRAGLLKSDMAKNRYIAGRGVLRKILSGYLGIEPVDVRIAAGEHGKPFLADCLQDLRFNLSHADDLLVLAVAAHIEVGVDIEKVEAGKPLHDMARFAFSRQEQEELLSLQASQQHAAAFYRCWARKEACLKACGRGFSLSGRSFNVSPLNEAATLSGVCCDNTFWHVLDIDVPYNYCAALAVEICSPDLHPPAPVRISYRLSYL
jgi:4'-phosphopantetheinyl transferase